MRRALVPLVLIALLLAPARGEERDELPRHFLSDKTVAGEWCTLEATLTADPPTDAVPKRLLVTYRVQSVEGGHFAVLTETEPHHPGEWEPRRYRRGSKSLRELLHLERDGQIRSFDASRKEELKWIGGRGFKCYKITFVTVEGALEQKNELWLNTDMKSLRIAALSTRVISGSRPQIGVDMELRGYGIGDQVLWGKRAQDLK